MGRVVFGGSTCQVLAMEIAREADFEAGYLTIKKFPDGERYLRIESDVEGKECIVVQSTCRPQDKNVLELLSILDTLRDLGAEKIISVVPYYGYSRQDKSFNPGECISSKTIAKHIQLNSDAFFTVNIHQKHVLDFFEIPAEELDATPLLGEYYKTLGLETPVVVAPDKGAKALAEGVAKVLGCDTDYLKKKRLGPGRVEVKPKEVEVQGSDMIIVDDIIDSGGTMLEAMKMLKAQGAEEVFIGCIHPVLTGNITTRLYSAGAADVVATNTIPSQISRVSVSPLIAKAL